jgi:hypothetical protein
MQALGMQTARDVCSVKHSKPASSLLARTLVFRMHAFLQSSYWADVGWPSGFTKDFSYGKLLVSVMQDWRKARKAGRTHLPGELKELKELGHAPSVDGNNRAIEKVARAMQKVGLYTVESMISKQLQWGLLEYRHLPESLRRSVTQAEHKVFEQCLETNRAACQLLHCRRPDVLDLLLHQADRAQHPDPPANGNAATQPHNFPLKAF